MKPFYRTTFLSMGMLLVCSLPGLGFADAVPVVVPCDNCTLITQSKIDETNNQLVMVNGKLDINNTSLGLINTALIGIGKDIADIKNFLMSTADTAALFYSNFTAGAVAADQLIDPNNTATNSQTNSLSASFIGGTDVDNNQNAAYDATHPESTADGFSSLSATSLLQGDQYGTNQASMATRYITTLSGVAVRTTNPKESDKGAKKTLNRNNMMAAVQSLSAYNLSKLASERTGVKIQGSLANSSPPVDVSGNASTKTVLDYLYRTTVSNGDNFLTPIGTDSASTLSRKTVYLLAGVFTALYRMEQNEEQMIATQSATNSMLILLAQIMMESQPPNAEDVGDQAIGGANAATTGVSE